MKKHLTIILLSLCCTIAFAQNEVQDVVYLKNGTVLRGKIIERIKEKSIVIETAKGEVFYYEWEAIDEIKEELYEKQGENKNLKNYRLQKGYRGIIELGFETGMINQIHSQTRANIVNGFQLNRYFYLGLGAGIREVVYNRRIPQTLVPIFGDFRAYFMDNSISPYFSLGAGYSFNPTIFRGNSSQSFESVGMMINPAVGGSFMITEGMALNAAIGIELQRIPQRWTFDKVNTYGINFNVGLSF